jgi:nicotinamidase-related amidase
VIGFWDGRDFVSPDSKVMDSLLTSDVLILCGETISHCVGASGDHLIARIQQNRSRCKIYVLEDGTSSVPGYEKEGAEALERFRNAGFHIVRSTTPMWDWPEFPVGIFEPE